MISCVKTRAKTRVNTSVNPVEIFVQNHILEFFTQKTFHFIPSFSPFYHRLLNNPSPLAYRKLFHFYTHPTTTTIKLNNINKRKD